MFWAPRTLTLPTSRPRREAAIQTSVFRKNGDRKSNPPPVEATAAQLERMMNELEEYYGMTPILYATEEACDMYLKGRFDAYPLWIRDVIHQPDIDRENSL